MADMINHEEDHNVIWEFDNNLKGYKMLTIRPVKKGEALSTYYGVERTNSDIF